MSIVEAACKKEKIRLQADTLPKEMRTVRCFQRLIAAMRAAEAEVHDQLRESQRQANESLENCLRLQERLHQAEAELLQLRLKAHMDDIPALTVSDKARVLELTTVVQDN